MSETVTAIVPPPLASMLPSLTTAAPLPPIWPLPPPTVRAVPNVSVPLEMLTRLFWFGPKTTEPVAPLATLSVCVPWKFNWPKFTPPLSPSTTLAL